MSRVTHPDGPLSEVSTDTIREAAWTLREEAVYREELNTVADALHAVAEAREEGSD